MFPCELKTVSRMRKSILSVLGLFTSIFASLIVLSLCKGFLSDWQAVPGLLQLQAAAEMAP